MDVTSRKLVRRARIRRNHERQVRVAAVKSRKRTALPSNDPLEQLLDRKDLGLLDESSNTSYSHQSTIPSLPTLSGSHYLTAASTTSKRNSKTAEDLSSTIIVPSVLTPYPGHVKDGSRAPELGGSADKPRHKRVRGLKKSDPFIQTVSDSNVPSEASTRKGGTHCDRFSDSAVSAQIDPYQMLGGDLIAQSMRKHGRVRPQAANVKRKKAKQMENLKSYTNSNKIETVMEEKVSEERQHKECAAASTTRAKQQEGVTLNDDLDKMAGQHTGHMLSSNVPTSPALSRMVRQKTENLNISKSTLQQIKEMSSHLRIVNWLWDSTNEIPPQHARDGRAAGRKAKSFKASSPGAATTVTSKSDNLVLVRKGADANWFDLPRVGRCQEVVCGQEQLSPISINSDLKSDYEDELMSLV